MKLPVYNVYKFNLKFKFFNFYPFFKKKNLPKLARNVQPVYKIAVH